MSATGDTIALEAELRTLNPWTDMQWPEKCRAAADTIETLRKERDEAREHMHDAMLTADSFADRLKIAEAQNAKLRKVLAALGFGGNPVDEKIGWCGTTPAPSTNDHFRCEFCAEEHINCTDIPHKEKCPVVVIRTALEPSP